MKRRRFLRSASAALAAVSLPVSGQFQLLPRREIEPLIAEVTGGAVAQRGGVTLELPTLAENGNSVALRIRVASPMTAADHVSAIHVFAERNPRPRIAAFHLGPQSGRAEVATHVRLSGSQRVTVLASLSGGRFRVADFDVVVTSTACLDEGA
jgi:sulfur-oxidizing protein SoxY